MKYTLNYILQNRYDPNRNNARRMSEKFIPLNIIVKFLSPYTTYIFLNFGIKPDAVTFLSMAFVVFGTLMFLLGHAFYGIMAIFIFGLLDSTDGDMARCVGPSKYGGTLDSFGADFFYAFIPASVGFYLYSIDISLFGFDSVVSFLAGALASVTFLLYRLVNAKMISYLREQGQITKEFFTRTHFERKVLGKSFLFKLIKLYRHELVKGNFFSEPGLIFWISILVVFSQYELLAYYIAVVAFYNTGYLAINLVRTYLTFIKV